MRTQGIWRQETVRPEGLAHERFVRMDLEEAEALHLDARLAIATTVAPKSPSKVRKGGYRVVMDDNFHYTDAEERSDAGTFATRAEALARAKAIVEQSLVHLYKPGITAEELWDYYTSFGDDPFIVPASDGDRFSACAYAKAVAPRVIAETARQSRGDGIL